MAAETVHAGVPTGAPAPPPPAATTAPVERKAGRRAGWTEVLTPNAVLPQGMQRAIIGFWVAVFALFWVTAPGGIPSPVEVYQELARLATTQFLVGHLWASLWLNVRALFLSAAIALGLAYLSPVPLLRPLVSATASMRYLSLAGFTYLATVHIHDADTRKLVLLTGALTFFFVLSMKDEIDRIPQAEKDYYRTLRMSPWEVVRETAVFGRAHIAWDILIGNAAIGWMMLPMIESLARSQGGLGALLLAQERNFSLAAIFGVQLLFLTIGLGQAFVFRMCRDMMVNRRSLGHKEGA